MITTKVKVLIGAGVVALLLLSHYGMYSHGRYLEGLECANTNLEVRDKEIKDAIALAKQDWEAQLKISEDGKQNVTQTVEKIGTIEKKIPTIVTRCDDLGSDFGLLYNEITGTLKPRKN